MFKKTKKELISFEKRIYDLFEAGELPYLLHLCGGNEDQLIEIFSKINEGDWVFSTHRSHYHYLLKGGNEQKLLDKIKGGDSMFIFDKELNFYSSSVLAGCTGIAVGVAEALKREGSPHKVWCFIGDGAEDEGHFYEAVRYASGKNIPCTFIIEDNDRSVDTTKEGRGSNGFRIESPHIFRYDYKPTYPHASTGSGRIVQFTKESIDSYLSKVQ